MMTEVYLFLAVSPEDGTEGIVGYAPLMGFGEPIPLEKVLPQAQRIATSMQARVRLVRFSTREEVAEILPIPSKKGNHEAD